MNKEFRPTVDLTQTPTVEKALFDDQSLYRIVVGPVGSGKTYSFLSTEIMRIAMAQHVFPGTETSDRAGVRRSRFAIIRNTTPELRSTTIKTWLELWNENAVGPLIYSSPITHRIYVPPTATVPGVEAEVMFLGLDRPADIAKAKSLEVTAVAFNEISELPVEIVRYIRRRVGRFPPKRSGVEAVRPCVIGDSNATDEDHWLAQWANEPQKNFAVYRQPPAVVEVQNEKGRWKCVEHLPRLYGMEFDDGDVIRGAGRSWAVNPFAENLNNLRSNYYQDQIAGATLAEIQRDLQAKWVYVQDGKPCIPGYQDDYHSADDVPILSGVPLDIGIDIGGGTLNPAAVIGQRTSRGGWLIHTEVVGTDLGVESFIPMLKMGISDLGDDDLKIGAVWGDPAGEKGDEYYNTAVFDHLRRQGNFPVRAAPSNDPQLRIEAIENAANRILDQKPALMIHKRCRRLRKALSGGWHFRRMQVSGAEARYQDRPYKNHPDSDLGDACGYLMLGGGEHRRLTKGQSAAQQLPSGRTHQAKIEFDVFG